MATWDDLRRIALVVPDVGVNEALVAAEPEELVVEAWLDRAPKRLAKTYLDESRS